MTLRLAPWLIAACTLLGGAGASLPVQAQTRGSTLSELSVLPLASVAVAGSAVVDSVVAVPLALSMAGAVLVVKAVESTARGTVYLLERVSDGAQASVEVLGKGLHGASMVLGTSVTVSAMGAGVLLSAAGEVVAFIPNALGRALMHNERLTN